MLQNQNPVNVHFPTQADGVAHLPALPVLRRLPWYVVLPLRLAPVIFLLALAVRATTIFFSPPRMTDAFSPYEAIMPGQSTAVLDAYSCHLNQEWEALRYSMAIPPPHQCDILPEQGIFQAITISFEDKQIQSVIFSSDTLQLEKLIQRSGIPAVARVHRQAAALRWDLGTYTVTSPTSHRFEGTALRVVVITQKSHA